MRKKWLPVMFAAWLLIMIALAVSLTRNHWADHTGYLLRETFNPIPGRFIVVHHSLSNWGDGETVTRWHTAPRPYGYGWEKPGYHVVIGNGYPTWESYKKRRPVPGADGRADRIWPENQEANGVRFDPINTLHVCLIGNLDEYAPTPKQIETLVSLLALWCRKYDINPELGILGHGEMQRFLAIENYSKTCPGRRVDMNAIRRLVARRIARTPSNQTQSN